MQFSQALEWYTKAIEANGDAYDVYTNRASTYAALKMWEEALSDAREAVRIKPDWLKVSRQMDNGDVSKHRFGE